jgi:hypothetical protein
MKARMTLQIAITRGVAAPPETAVAAPPAIGPTTTAEGARTTTAEAARTAAPARPVFVVERLLFRHRVAGPARRILETTWRQWREPGAAAALMGLEACDTVRPDPFGSRWPTPLP